MTPATSSGHRAGIAYFPAARACGARPQRPGLLARAWTALGGWRERSGQRRELAALSPRDLADLGIPPALAAFEMGRWPWQKASPEWREIAAARCEAAPLAPLADPAAR